MSMSGPVATLKYIQDAYHRHYDTAFWLRDPKLLAERRLLLEETGSTAREALLEAVLPYPSTTPIAEVCTRVGLDNQTGKILFKADSSFRIRDHQAQVASPPDILITNVSMLNVMLMRDVEEPVFEKTRARLGVGQSDRERIRQLLAGHVRPELAAVILGKLYN
jgi:ATP-dependent helicase YprA (DUF1998 family)